MANFLDAKPMATLMSSSKLLSKVDSYALVDPLEYRRLVGSFQYPMLTRPNIAFGINKLCQFMAFLA